MRAYRFAVAAIALAGCRSGDVPDVEKPDVWVFDMRTNADGANDCSALVDPIAREMYSAAARTCTATVRLDYKTRAILGWQLFCNHYAGTIEANARATAQADTGYGDGDGSTLVDGPNPTDEFVFLASPSDFGGVSAVGTRSGLSVFGGSIVWSGMGDITYPKSWRDPSLIGHGCPTVGHIPSARGFSLVPSGPLAQQSVDAALAVVTDTALPAAIWAGGYVFDALVLVYPRTGTFNPDTAEWIVMINGGWLE